jgi:hypothetical protein
MVMSVVLRLLDNDVSTAEAWNEEMIMNSSDASYKERLYRRLVCLWWGMLMPIGMPC